MQSLMWVSSYVATSQAYRVYNQNSQIIQESSYVVINDTGYNHDIRESQILTQELNEDNLENVEILEYNPNDVPKSNVDSNKGETVP